MGNPAKRRSVKAMVRRWRDDEARLIDLFGEIGGEKDYTDSAEMLRNLGSAIAYADGYLSRQPKGRTR